MTTTANTIFQAFIEAQKAMDELPAVEAELAKTKSELETTHHSLDDAELRAMALEDELTALKKLFDAKEEALAAATFREQEVAHKLAVIQSVIGIPTPTPVVVERNPIAAEGRTETVATETVQGQGAEGGPTMSHSDNAGQTSETGPSASPQSGVSTDPATDQRDADPTAHNTQGEGALGSTIAGNTGASGTINTERRPYWRKPADQSWADWTAAGNEPAPWLDREHNDPHAIV